MLSSFFYNAAALATLALVTATLIQSSAPPGVTILTLELLAATGLVFTVGSIAGALLRVRGV